MDITQKSFSGVEHHHAPPEDLREHARKARDLAETWHCLLTTLADELDTLAAERETGERPAPG